MDIVERLRRMSDMTTTGNDLGDIAKAADEIERLRERGQFLIDAMDDMHAKGETFTGRVSIAASELRAALHIKRETP